MIMGKENTIYKNYAEDVFSYFDGEKAGEGQPLSSITKIAPLLSR